MYGESFGWAKPQPYPPTSVVHHGMPLMLAWTPWGTWEASCSKELWMSELHSTTPWRWPPAHTPRVSTRGGSVWPGSAATVSEKRLSQSFTQRFEYAAGGPHDVL